MDIAPQRWVVGDSPPLGTDLRRSTKRLYIEVAEDEDAELVREHGIEQRAKHDALLASLTTVSVASCMYETRFMRRSRMWSQQQAPYNATRLRSRGLNGGEVGRMSDALLRPSAPCQASPAAWDIGNCSLSSLLSQTPQMASLPG